MPSDLISIASMEKRIARQDQDHQVAFAFPTEEVNVAMPDRRSGPSVETSINVPSEITSGPISEPTGEIIATMHATILSSQFTHVHHQQTVASSSIATATPYQPVASPSHILDSN